MSGGSYGYIYSKLWNECGDRMYDPELNEMISDLCDVLHDLEWWQSSDCSEEEYRITLKRFKRKWFNTNREERLKKYIDDQVSIVREQLHKMIDLEIDEKNDSEVEK